VRIRPVLRSKREVWNLVLRTDDPKPGDWWSTRRPLSRREVGGLDRETGKPIEPKFEPSLGLIEDTAKQVSGPIWCAEASGGFRRRKDL